VNAPVPAPIPDAVADFKIRQWTRERRTHEVAYSNAARTYQLCRTEWTREAREYAIADMHRARKQLATLPTRLGGAS